MILTTDGRTLRDLVTGAVTARQAIRSGAVRLDGSLASLERTFDLFGVPAASRRSRDRRINA